MQPGTYSPDGMTPDQRARAWLATWSPSFAGKAIVSRDGIITAVNPEFAAYLRTTPGELLGRHYEEITPAGEIKETDIKNADLVLQGKQKSYLLEKWYKVGNAPKVKATLRVTGVLGDQNEFLFFAAEIMELAQESGTSTKNQKSPDVSFQDDLVIKFYKKYRTAFKPVTIVIGFLLLYGLLDTTKIGEMVTEKLDSFRIEKNVSK